MRRQHASLSAIFSAIVIVLLSVLSGCRSSKSLIGQSGLDYSTMTLDERVHEVAAANIPWTQLNVPLKLSMKSPEKLSAGGRIYMRRNHDIYITLRVLGMEVANMYVNSDSVFVADKVHKYYIAESIDKIFAGASLSIGDIQDALLGRAFVNNRGTLTDSLLQYVDVSDTDGKSWTVAPRSKINGTIGYYFRFADSDNALKSFNADTGSKQYSFSYSDPATVGDDGSRFMQRLAIKTKAGKTDINATLTFDFDKVKWTVPESARWRTPKNYKRIDPRALSKALAED